AARNVGQDRNGGAVRLGLARGWRDGQRCPVDGEGGAGFRGRQGRGIVGIAGVLRRDRVTAGRLRDREPRRVAAQRHRAAVGRAVDQERHGAVGGCSWVGGEGGGERDGLAVGDGGRTRCDDGGRRRLINGEGGAGFIRRQGAGKVGVAEILRR